MQMDVNGYLEAIGAWMMTTGLEILLILIVAAIALRIASFVSNRFLTVLRRRATDVEFQKRADTLKQVISYVFTTVIAAVTVMLVLGELGIEIGPILAAAGVIGLAVGFGAQNLVQDVISGFFILFEDQIRVGDVVEIAGKSGLVERVNLRMTILRDLSGNVHYVRNGKIEIVTNMTKEFSRYVLDVGVAYGEDVDQVMTVMKEIDEELRNDPAFKDDMLEPLEMLGVDQFADSAVMIKARLTTRPIQQWRIGREFKRRLKKRFDELGIEIPFPQVTLSAARPKRDGEPVLPLELRRASGTGR